MCYAVLIGGGNEVTILIVADPGLALPMLILSWQCCGSLWGIIAMTKDVMRPELTWIFA